MKAAGHPNQRISRYHVAMMMELHYGRHWSFRRIGNLTGLAWSTVREAIREAEAGKQFPEVTPHFIPVIPNIKEAA